MSDKELILKYLPKYKHKKALNKLEKNYPVQYLIGNTEFVDNLIFINKNVLIPRFETEYLVEKTLAYIKKYNIKNPNIIDLCTGSGCIAISLKSKIKCRMTALDISKKAIKLAKKNAKYNNVVIDFICNDINKFNPEEKYDVIISNPPYVIEDEIIDIKTKYEPQIALFAKDNGLYFYKLILNKYKNNLKSNYLICFEIGMTQGDYIAEFAKKLYPDALVSVEKDLTGKDRYVFITNYE